MTFVASPVNHWHEDPTNGSAVSLVALVPYETTDGHTVFVQRGDQPAGATEMSTVDPGSGFDTLVTPVVTTGRRIAQNGNGFLFLM